MALHMHVSVSALDFSHRKSAFQDGIIALWLPDLHTFKGRRRGASRSLGGCMPAQMECSGWAKSGYCETNPTYMLGGTDLGLGCRKSCRRCHANARIKVMFPRHVHGLYRPAPSIPTTEVHGMWV